MSRLRPWVVGALTGVVAGAAPGGGGLPAATAAPRGEPAHPAQRFVDSIGVVTHAGYFDTSYGDWDRVVAALRRLGVRHVRDALLASPEPRLRDATGRAQRAVIAAAAAGVRFDFLISAPEQGGSVDEQLAALTGPLRGTAESLEGPNEPDAGEPDWVAATRARQQELYRAAKASPALRALPVIGPSLVQPASRAALGDLRGALDAGNIHPYTGAAAPSPERLQQEARLAAAVSGSAPLYATEVGFHDALRATTGQPPASERAAAVYTLRSFLEHFRAGVVRTFAYELLDEKPDPAGTDPEQHFGLLRADFSEKPAFVALARLVDLLGPRAGGAAVTRTAAVRVGADPQRVHRLLLDRGGDEHSLVLWQGASVWDRDARRDLPVRPLDVRVSSAGMTAAAVARPLTGTGSRRVDDAGDTASVAVGADPVILTWRTGATESTGAGPRAALLVAAGVLVAAGLVLLARRRR